MIPDSRRDRKEIKLCECAPIEQNLDDQSENERIHSVHESKTDAQSKTRTIENKPAACELPSNHLDTCDELKWDTRSYEYNDQEIYEEVKPKSERCCQGESETTDREGLKKDYVLLDPATIHRPLNPPVYLRLAATNKM